MAWLTDEEYLADDIAGLERELRDIERMYGDGRVTNPEGLAARERRVRAELEEMRAQLPLEDDRDEE